MSAESRGLAGMLRGLILNMIFRIPRRTTLTLLYSSRSDIRGRHDTLEQHTLTRPRPSTRSRVLLQPGSLSRHPSSSSATPLPPLYVSLFPSLLSVASLFFCPSLVFHSDGVRGRHMCHRPRLMYALQRGCSLFPPTSRVLSLCF